jgi:hypothetical protein
MIIIDLKESCILNEEVISDDKARIYIVLTKMDSLLASAIRKVTNSPYSHVGLSFEKSLDTVYSFNAERPGNPNPFSKAGFSKEGALFYKRTTPELEYVIYSMEIPIESYNILKTKVKWFEDNREKFKFNKVGLLGFLIDSPIQVKEAFFCSEFVATLFKEAKLELFNKPPSLVSPVDFIKTKAFKFEKRGKIKNYKIKG